MKICNTCHEGKAEEHFYMWSGKLSSICKPCNRSKVRQWQTSNKAKYADRQAKYRAENSEKLAEYYTSYYTDNKVGILKKRKSWKEANKDKVYKACAKRRASKLKSIPDMGESERELNDLVLEESYELALLRSKLTAIPWHVDHKVPLNSKYVCGLHWYHNIAVITAEENLRKSNTYWEYQW